MKSTDAQVREFILAPMTALYGPPRGVERAETALEQYLKALRPYPPEALEGAWIAITATHARTTWPLPAEIIKAARDWIQTNIKPDAAQTVTSAKEDWKRYPELAAKAMQHEMGQRGLREGWGRILYSYVFKNGTFKGFSAADAIRTDAEIRHLVAELENEQAPSALTRQNVKLGRSLIAKETALQKEYLVEA